MSGRVAELQVVLEGVRLPAAKRELVAHGRGEDAPRAIVALLEALPEREYASIDEVAETIQPVQPASPRPQPHEPKPESGAPPGGEAYTAPPARAR